MARESSASSNFSSASVSSACLLRQFLEPCFGVTRFSCFHAFARTWLRSWVCCSCRSNSSIRISRLITLRKQRKRNRILLALSWKHLSKSLAVVDSRVRRSSCSLESPYGVPWRVAERACRDAGIFRLVLCLEGRKGRGSLCDGTSV